MERRADPGDQDRRVDFFISYTATDRAWAEWIAWELEEAGYQVLIQDWDFRPGSDFVAAMRGATVRDEKTVAVLSPDYLHSNFAISESGAAYAADPLGRQGKLVPVRVAEFAAEGLDRSRVWIDLVGLDEDQARQRLVAGLARDRAKPDQPPGFPPPHAATSAPRFPLSMPPVWNVVHHPNPNFTGREAQLGAIEARSPAPTVLTRPSPASGAWGRPSWAWSTPTATGATTTTCGGCGPRRR